jgi:hypothetical protein
MSSTLQCSDCRQIQSHLQPQSTPNEDQSLDQNSINLHTNLQSKSTSTEDQKTHLQSKDPKLLQTMTKDKVEHLLLQHICQSDEEKVEEVLSLFQLDLSSKSRPEVNRELCNGWTPLTMAAQVENLT